MLPYKGFYFFKSYIIIFFFLSIYLTGWFYAGLTLSAGPDSPLPYFLLLQQLIF